MGERTPWPVAVGVLEMGGLFFVARRRLRERAFPHHWEFPGGKYQEGEDWAAAVKREWLEECGIEVVPLEPILTIKVTSPLTGSTFDLTAGRIYAEEKPKIGPAHDQFRWLPAQEVRGLAPATPSTLPIVEELLRRNFLRASGDMVCLCGKLYRKHEDDLGCLGWGDEPFLKILCDGTRVKL